MPNRYPLLIGRRQVTVQRNFAEKIDMEAISLSLALFGATWWFLTPLALFFILKGLWLYWRQSLFEDRLEWMLLEVRIPQEVLKTPKAMEYVLVGLHGAWDSLDTRDVWLKGEVLPWFGLEIVGIEGEMHFFIYTQKNLRGFVESKIYSQYPDAEILEAEDYTKLVPPDIPNKEWDLWGTDLKFNMPSPYPIRTYADFEEMVEERRLDSIASIAEVMNKLGPGEHMWIQIIITPAMNELHDEGEEMVKKLMGRPIEKKKGILASVAGLFGGELLKLFGSAGEEKPEDFFLLPEFRLTAGEREVIKKIEEKTSKIAFSTMVRMIYLGRRDVFNAANISSMFGFSRLFNTHNLNSFRPNSNSYPKSSFVLFPNLRKHMRKLRLIYRYKSRKTLPGGVSPYFLMNVEEIASMFHFPGQVVKAPAIPRVESRKAPPPPGLPVDLE